MEPVTPQLAHTPARPPGDGSGGGPPAPPLTRLRKFAKRAMFVGLGLLIIALVIFFMLPVWMSNEQGRNYILSRLNKRINGTINVESWKLGWFSGTEIKNLTLTLPDGKVLLTCPRIKTDLTLWSLLWGNFDLGNTRVDSPQVIAAKYVDGSTDFSRLLDTPSSAAGPNPLKTLRAFIVCNNGFLELLPPGASTPLLIHEISAKIPIAAHDAPIHLTANGLTAGVGPSHPVSLVADLPGPSTWTSNPYALLRSVQIRAGSVPTAALAEWLNLDPRWDQSFGPTLSSVTLVSEPEGANQSLVTVAATGSIGSFVARLHMEPRVTVDGTQVLLSLAEAKGEPTLLGRVRLSPPVVELLSHVNPVFAGITSTDDTISVSSDALALDLLDPATATGRLFLNLPGVTLRPTQLLREILALTGAKPPDNIAAQVDTAVNLTLKAGRISHESMTLMLLPRTRLSFSGSIGFDDSVDLTLDVRFPRHANGAVVGTERLRLLISGTTRSPRLQKP